MFITNATAPSSNQFASVPQELKNLNRWVCWRYETDMRGRKKKVPYNPFTAQRASFTNPATWVDFSTVVKAVLHFKYNGIGFVFSDTDEITGVDIDDCYNPDTGQFTDIALAIIAHCPTYAEFSPSGTGVHLYYHGVKPAGACRKATMGVEMYNTGRFFTVTGKPLVSDPRAAAALGMSQDSAVTEAPAIATDEGTLAWIHETYLAETAKTTKAAKPRKEKRKKTTSPDITPTPLSDEDIISRARLAKNGETFRLLYAGDWQNPALSDPSTHTPRYGSQSEADLALCNQLAFWTRKDQEQMDRLFRLSGLMRPKWDEKHHGGGRTYGEETISRACDFITDTYNPVESPVFEANGCYYRTRGEATYQITNFIFRPVEMIVSDDETQLTADLVTPAGEVFRQTFMTTDFANLQKFKNLLNRRTIALTYTGSEGDLELLKGFLSTLHWAIKRGVKASGLYQHEGRSVFVTSDAAMEAGGLMVSDIVQLEKYESIKSDILNTNVLSPERFTTLAQWLLSYNEPAKTVSVLAWCAACFLKPYLRMYNVKFPHLFMIGEAGSGKSNTLERIVLPIFSRTRVVAAGQVTAFTLMKDSASSNMIPQPLDEFKPSKIDKMRLNVLYNHFRDCYDAHEGQRGRADQTTVFYELLAPLIVAGEESADEAAVRERSVELLFSKKDLKDVGCRTSFKRLCVNTELLEDLGRSLLEEALRTEPHTAYQWYEDALSTFSSELPSRVSSNLACCAAGLILVEKLVDGLGLSWNAVFPYTMETCHKYLEFAAETYLLDGGTSNRSIVEQTFEIMARMDLIPQRDYTLSDDGKVLYLWLNHVYDEYTKFRKDHAIMGEVLTFGQFTKQLKFSDIYIESGVQKRIGNENHRVFVINFELLKSRCDVSGFDKPMLIKGNV